MKRFTEILKNHQKQYKVLQKTRFGETAIDEQISLEGLLGPIFILSWHVRGHLGAKRGKLTPLGGLRGTKLELKGALGAPREAPREPKWATRIIDQGSGEVGFWPGGPPKIT